MLVAVHEFGHFWVARKLGVKVLTFSIGFGKPIWSWRGKVDNTEYMIARIPLGGYVKMLGQGESVDPIHRDESHRAFDNQSVWKRGAIVAAGPGINFLFAAMLFMGLGWINTQQLVPQFGVVPQESILGKAGIQAGDELLSVNGKPVEYFAQFDLYIFNQVLKREPVVLELLSDGRQQSVEIQTQEIPIYRISPTGLMRQLGFTPLAPPDSRVLEAVLPDSPAEKAGLLKGDEIKAIDGSEISSWSELSEAVGPSAGKTLQLVVNRDGEELGFSIVPEAVKVADQEIARIGVQRVWVPYPESQQVTIDRNPVEALQYGVSQTWLMSTLTLRMLWKMVTLQVSHENVNGPIMIADVAGKAIQVGPETYLFFLAVVSISLGVMNLLPIPILDGGHLLSYVIEVVAGKSLAERAFIALQPLGLVMLAGLMSLAFYNDILKIFN